MQDWNKLFINQHGKQTIIDHHRGSSWISKSADWDGGNFCNRDGERTPDRSAVVISVRELLAKEFGVA